MAITKIKSIKSTIRKAISYIINPEKTDDGILVSSFGCSPETADIEFDFTRSKSRGVGTNLGYHAIQSFMEGEITMEEAHRLGKELASGLLQGKYEYVIATHIDKGHIHNHIIFNSVSYVTNRKYHVKNNELGNIRTISDRICSENGYTVIEIKEKENLSMSRINGIRAGSHAYEKILIRRLRMQLRGKSF